MPGLLDSISIGSLDVPNRLVMPPMDTGLATEAGEVTDPAVEHYRRRAPGVGLLIVEHSYVALAGRSSSSQLGIDRDRLVPGLRRLARAVKDQGSCAAIQINHCGGKALPDPAIGSPSGPSGKIPPGSGGGVTPRPLTVEEIGTIVAAFGQAARRAKEAGFDAVEVHGAHGYLNSQFVSPITNGRSDRYGGSLENRMRLLLEIVTEVRRRVGSGYPVLYRLGATDMMEGGLTLLEGRRVASALADVGVDAVHVSGGLVGPRHPDDDGQGYFMPLAEQIKSALPPDVPVIGVGGVSEPEYADDVVRQGRVDMVAVGRAILNDPSWARDALDGLSRSGRGQAGGGSG